MPGRDGMPCAFLCLFEANYSRPKNPQCVIVLLHSVCLVITQVTTRGKGTRSLESLRCIRSLITHPPLLPPHPQHTGTRQQARNSAPFKIMARSSRRSSRSSNRSRSFCSRASSSRRNRAFLFGAVAMVSVLLVLVRGRSSPSFPAPPPSPPSPPSPPRRSQPPPPLAASCLSLPLLAGALTIPSSISTFKVVLLCPSPSFFLSPPPGTIIPHLTIPPSSFSFYSNSPPPPPFPCSLSPSPAPDTRQRAPPLSRPHHHRHH